MITLKQIKVFTSEDETRPQLTGVYCDKDLIQVLMPVRLS